MKKYIPEKMVQISRCRNYFPTLPKEIQDEILKRMAELLKKKKNTAIRATVNTWHRS